MGIIPETVKKEVGSEPDRFVLYGQSKVGKSTALNALSGNLIVDLESGYKYLEGSHIIDVNQQAKELKISPYATLVNIYTELAADPDLLKKFKFITFDTIDVIENIIGEVVAEGEGVAHYQEIGYGKGFTYVKDRVLTFMNRFIDLGLKVIIVGHRTKQITGEAEHSVSVKDLALTGKLKNWVFSWADAIGYMHRAVEEDDNFLSTNIQFKTDILESLEGGCRITHLQNQDVRIMTYDHTKKEFVYNNWKQIFPVSVSVSE